MTESRTPRILLTNDDGIDAPGLAAIEEGLRSLGELWVVAPDREQSGCGHAMTLMRPLRVQERGERRYSVDGTPTDCVNLGLDALLDERPDLVVSGINLGLNLGDDVRCSGTVSAAVEAALLGVPGLALSQQFRPGEPTHWDRAGALGLEIVKVALAFELGPRDIVNVNLPDAEPGGAELARLSRRVYENVVERSRDPRGRELFWIAGRPVREAAEDTDYAAIRRGNVSVTPLRVDTTDGDAFGRLSAFSEGVAERLDAFAGAH